MYAYWFVNIQIFNGKGKSIRQLVQWLCKNAGDNWSLAGKIYHFFFFFNESLKKNIKYSKCTFKAFALLGYIEGEWI